MEKELVDHVSDLLEEFPRLEVLGSAEFDLYGSRLVTDKNESRCMELDRGLGIFDRLISDMSGNEAAFKAADYDMKAMKLVEILRIQIFVS